MKRVPVDWKGEFFYPHLVGSRDGFHYKVYYWPVKLESSAPPDWSRAVKKEGTEVYVVVYRDLAIGRDRP